MENIRNKPKEEALEILCDSIKSDLRKYAEKSEAFKNTSIMFRVMANSLIPLAIDYSSRKKLYTKDQAKDALNLFNIFSNNISMMLDIWNMCFPDDRFEYEIGKTMVSSAKIGKELYVYEVPRDFNKTFRDIGMGDGRYFESKCLLN